jgi:hypothetical protein
MAGAVCSHEQSLEGNAAIVSRLLVGVEDARKPAFGLGWRGCSLTFVDGNDFRASFCSRVTRGRDCQGLTVAFLFLRNVAPCAELDFQVPPK